MIVWTFIVASLALVFGVAGAYLSVAAGRRGAPRRELPGTSLVHSCGGTWGKWEPRRLVGRGKYGDMVEAGDLQQRACTECGFVERVKVKIGNVK